MTVLHALDGGSGLDEPPQDQFAEQSVLGAMLLSPDAVADITGTITAADFYKPAHQTIFDCVLDLYSHGNPADPVVVGAELERRGQLSRVGGLPYLHTLIAAMPTVANASYYADIVADKAKLRRLLAAGARIAQLAHHGADGADVAEVLARAHGTLDAVSEDRERSDTRSFGQLGDAILAQVDDFQSGALRTGIRTGILDLDAVTNGLHPGQMIIVAGRPGLGKSVLGIQFAREAAIRYGHAAAIFSLEMSAVEIGLRVISAETRIRGTHLNTENGLTQFDRRRLAERMRELADAPLFVDDSPNLTMVEIRAKARRLKQRNDLKLIVVDYLQLMTSGKRVESRQQEVYEFSRQLKLLAKELEVPLIAISQLNRGPEERTDKRPMLSDLRESGSLEQDADMVILVHRPDAYDRDDPRAGEADLILAKHRGGPTATITVANQLHVSTFGDFTKKKEAA